MFNRDFLFKDFFFKVFLIAINSIKNPIVFETLFHHWGKNIFQNTIQIVANNYMMQPFSFLEL